MPGARSIAVCRPTATAGIESRTRSDYAVERPAREHAPDAQLSPLPCAPNAAAGHRCVYTVTSSPRRSRGTCVGAVQVACRTTRAGRTVSTTGLSSIAVGRAAINATNCGDSSRRAPRWELVAAAHAIVAEALREDAPPLAPARAAVKTRSTADARCRSPPATSTQVRFARDRCRFQTSSSCPLMVRARWPTAARRRRSGARRQRQLQLGASTSDRAESRVDLHELLWLQCGRVRALLGPLRGVSGWRRASMACLPALEAGVEPGGIGSSGGALGRLRNQPRAAGERRSDRRRRSVAAIGTPSTARMVRPGRLAARAGARRRSPKSLVPPRIPSAPNRHDRVRARIGRARRRSYSTPLSKPAPAAALRTR